MMNDEAARPLAALTDEEVVRRYHAGLDPEGAVMELYERYNRLTYGFLRRRIGIPEIAAEENQELYLTLLGHLKEFRSEASFRTWLFQIAHYRLSHLRRRWGVHVDERAEEVPEELWGRIAGPESGPERQAARREVTRALKACLAKLPEIERAVVFGQYYAGITLQMLSREMKLANPSGARALLIAAQRKLRRCLQEAGFEASAALESVEGAT